MRSLLSRLFLSKPASTGRYGVNYKTRTSVAQTLLARFLPFLFKHASRRMDVRKDTIAVEAVRLLQDIADSHFVAFDFEFSGVESRTRVRGNETKPSVKEHYEAVRAAVQQFQPLQIGLTIAKLDEAKGRYVLEPYNFNINPVPSLRERYFNRTWSMQSGAVSFLQNNGFDFQQQFLHGVPYLSRQEEREVRANMAADVKRTDMEWKAHDEPLVNHIRDEIAKWQALPESEREDFLNIPNSQGDGIPAELTRYQIRLVHQIVENEFSAMKTKSMGHFVQVTNPTEEQQASQRLIEEQYREKDIGRAIGLRWILDGMTGHDISYLPEDWLLSALPSNRAAGDEAARQTLIADLTKKLRDRPKILIGHNCFTDLMFLYKMIVGDLPLTVEEFTDKLHDMFPAIVDTKYLAMNYHEKFGRIGLGDVERDLRSETVPDVYTSGEFDRYINDAYLHEAGYDSYITAIVAIKLASKLHKEGSLKKKDHERQAQGVVAAAATMPRSFGVQDAYVTAPECQDDPDIAAQPSASPQQRPPTLAGVTSSFAGSSSNVNGVSADDTTFQKSPQTSLDAVVAVKSTAATMIPASVLPSTSRNATEGKTAIADTEEEVSSLQSAFATASVFDTLDSSTAARMPGAEEVQNLREETYAEKEVREKMNKMVKKGEMMPRWHEERAFWDFYGNRLQMNGTQEGSLKVA